MNIGAIVEIKRFENLGHWKIVKILPGDKFVVRMYRDGYPFEFSERQLRLVPLPESQAMRRASDTERMLYFRSHVISRCAAQLESRPPAPEPQQPNGWVDVVWPQLPSYVPPHGDDSGCWRLNGGPIRPYDTSVDPNTGSIDRIYKQPSPRHAALTARDRIAGIFAN